MPKYLYHNLGGFSFILQGFEDLVSTRSRVGLNYSPQRPEAHLFARRKGEEGG